MCISVYVYACVYIYTHAYHIYMCVFAYIYTARYICIYIYMYIQQLHMDSVRVKGLGMHDRPEFGIPLSNKIIPEGEAAAGTQCMQGRGWGFHARGLRC